MYSLMAHHLLLARPDEAVLFQALHQQPEAVATPAEYLDAIPSPVAERVERRRKRVQPHGLLDQSGQAVDRLPEVDCLAHSLPMCVNR